MEDVIIPGWVWGLGTVVVFTWLVYVTLMGFKGKERQSISDNNDQRILSDISRLEGKLTETKDHIDVSLEKFEVKFEKFENKVDKMFERAIDLLKLATKP
jgi:hypothetical protein